jgi:hypothetical protein
MSEFLFQYTPIHPTTWVYLSSLLLVGVFFKFGRFWSVRNVDLVLLILLAPGLLTVHLGEERFEQEQLAANITEEEAGEELDASDELAGNSSSGLAETPQVVPSSEDLDDASTPEAAAEDADRLSGERVMLIGYLWLLGVLLLFLVRLLLDSTMVRRPLLEPNLSAGGLAFIGGSLFVFLMANVVSSPVADDDLMGARSAEQLLQGVASPDVAASLQRHGPGHALLLSIPSLATTPLDWKDARKTNLRYARTAKVMAVLSHLAIIVGIVAVGYQHFSNIKAGIGVATLYLMMPYTSLMTGKVDHVLPGALLVWAILAYRRPFAAGSLIGLAVGAAYYPLFLLPLWISFYWQRGLMRFLSGTITTIVISVLSLIFVSNNFGAFIENVQQMFAIWRPEFNTENLLGVWRLGWNPTWRFPVFTAFLAICGSFCFWPPQKNLGTLLSCSAAVMVATQFWHGYGGGMYMAWFLPLTLLTIFRPNLEDRVALSVLGEGWFRSRRPQLRHIDRAA